MDYEGKKKRRAHMMMPVAQRAYMRFHFMTGPKTVELPRNPVGYTAYVGRASHQELNVFPASAYVLHTFNQGSSIMSQSQFEIIQCESDKSVAGARITSVEDGWGSLVAGILRVQCQPPTNQITQYTIQSGTPFPTTVPSQNTVTLLRFWPASSYCSPM